MSSLKTSDLFSVAGKTALVTGGGRGIGLMIAQAFTENGATVFISSRDAKQCEAAAAQLTANHGPGKCVALPADLSKVAGCIELAGKLRAALIELRGADKPASLDILVNNSGCSWGEPLEEYQEKGWDKVMDLNVKGLFFLTKELLPLLEAAATKAEPARVINVGSIAGIKPQLVPTYAYDASKAAVHHLTRHLAGHLADKYINVNAIAPGFVKSKMSSQLLTYASLETFESTIPRGRIGGTADMAGVALFLASPAGNWVTGAIIPVDGGVLSARL